MSVKFTFIGLFLTLLGACLLFIYGLPRKKIGNVIILSAVAMKYDPDSTEKDIPDSEWQPIADRFLKRAKIFNMMGFALVAIGTTLQMIAMCISD